METPSLPFPTQVAGSPLPLQPLCPCWQPQISLCWPSTQPRVTFVLPEAEGTLPALDPWCMGPSCLAPFPCSLPRLLGSRQFPGPWPTWGISVPEVLFQNFSQGLWFGSATNSRCGEANPMHLWPACFSPFPASASARGCLIHHMQLPHRKFQ